MTTPLELEDYVAHIVRHSLESGRDGSAHFTVKRELSRWDVADSASARWARGLDEPLWGRTWMLWQGPKVIGHLDLRGGPSPSELHRAVLAMGIERAFLGQGLGEKLMRVALDWARYEAKLSWVDLGVFATNERARRLYKRIGFVETGYLPDAFRLEDDVSVDDVPMTLDLRLWGVEPLPESRARG